MLIVVLAMSAALQPFEFKGYTAGLPIDQSRIERCEGDNPDSCTLKQENELIDGYRPLLSMVTAYKQRLSRVSVSADSIAFAHIVDAFRAKYGPPCAKSAPLWKSRVGRPIPNPTLTWCFSSGKLVATMHGTLIDVSDFDYRDTNIAPASKPHVKIDF